TYGSEGYGQYHRLALFDDQGTEVSSTNHVHGNSDMGFSVEGLTSGSEYFLTVDQGNGDSHRRGTFTLHMNDEAGYDLQSGALLISFDSNGEYRSSNAEFSTESGTS
ncbi:hypothetical protein, partial [Roseivirga sp. E12]|uniref:hypothetical protein n=1 Tax=Roseivirga sp. E12 TaxID=2819237 RepID=UPI001ABD16F8